MHIIPPDENITEFDPKKLRRLFKYIGILVAIISAWVNRYVLYPDGVSYLDIADNFLNTGFQGLVNSYWSPLYPFILAIFLKILKPSMYWEFGLVQFVNLLIFTLALFAFDLFLKELINYNKSQVKDTSKKEPIPTWSIIVIGYSIFLWSSILLTTIWKATPDMIIATLLYLISYFLLKIKQGQINKSTFIYIGLCLGLCFLAKTVILPVIYLYLIITYIQVKNLKGGLNLFLTTLLFFLLLISPYVYALSSKKGNLTFGDSSKLNYAWYINNVREFTHWQGECPQGRKSCPEIGRPKHPTRLIFNNPPIYEFSEPIHATYAAWFDPSYWYHGVTPYFDLKGHIEAVKKWKVEDKQRTFFGLSGGGLILIGFILIWYISGNRKSLFKHLQSYLELMIPSTISLASIILSNYNDRYIGPFIVLFWLSLYSALRLEINKYYFRIIKGITFVASFVLFVTIFYSCQGLYNDFKNPKAHIQYEVAATLKKIGINPQDKVANIGNSYWSTWARLARVRIIAEVTGIKDKMSNYWEYDKETRKQVLNIFASTGAKIVVTLKAPSFAKDEGWHKIKNTEYYFYDLRY